MNALIIDIRETSLRAVLRNDDGVLEYCRTFEFEPLKDIQGETVKHQQISIHDASSDNPYLLECHNIWNLELKEALKKIRSEISTKINATHLIIPPYEVVTATHQLPKMSRQDAENLIRRKISTESKEEFPPFSIIPGATDQKIQTWHSLYIPSSTLKLYRKAFAFSKLRLSSITTPVNAMINAFQSVREAIFNTHAVLEIQRGFVEAYYISGDGILYFERLPYASSASEPEVSDEQKEKIQKFRLFKIINTIFSINSKYQEANPHIPVQMVWVCGLENGLENGLDSIASSLKEAMGVEVAIAPAMPTGLPDESGYVPLAGFASALLNGTATSYSAADFLQRFPLRKTYGVAIYLITSVVALLALSLTEREYRKLRSQVKSAQTTVDSKQNKAKVAAAAANAKNLDALNKLTSRQFIFYDLFRELATDLPDGVYLDNLQFQLKDDKGFLDLTALSRQSDKKGESALLVNFIDMLDKSPTLTDYREPSISVVGKDKDRYLKITVTSEVNPLDTKK